MPWIKTIPYEEADTKLQKMYDRVKGPDNNVDNVLSIHSLRPHTLTGHMTLYKAVLHNSNNTLPKWYLEAIGVYVSSLNKCDYCVQHHYAGMKRLLNNDAKSEQILDALDKCQVEKAFDEKFSLGLKYGEQLTLNHTSINAEAVEKLRKTGFTDGEILEINQVASYFNYVNRMVLGLGVTTEGDIIGLSPNNSNDPDNWEHQ